MKMEFLSNKIVYNTITLTPTQVEQLKQTWKKLMENGNFFRSKIEIVPWTHKSIDGDPDGPLVPLPTKPEPKRIIPDFPTTTYNFLKGNP